MRSHTKGFLQMLRMHEKPRKLVFKPFQSEENTQSHIIDAAFHGTVHGFCVVLVVVFRTCRMKRFIAFLVIGLLEEDVGSDASFRKLSVVLHRGGRDVHIHSSYDTILVFHIIDGSDAFQYIVNGAVHRVFSCLEGKTLMSHVLKGHDFSSDFLLGELLSCNMLVLQMIRTVYTSVDAVVGQIKGCEHDDSVSIESFLDLFRQSIDLLIEIFKGTLQKDGRFSVVQSFAFSCLFDECLHLDAVLGLHLCIVQRLQDLFMTDEFFRIS